MLSRDFYEKLEDILSEVSSEEISRKANDLISVESFESQGGEKNIENILSLIEDEITPELKKIFEVFFLTQSEDGKSLLEHCLNHIYINTVSMVLSDLRSRINLGLEPAKAEFSSEFFDKTFEKLKKVSTRHIKVVRDAFEKEDEEI